MRPLHLELAKEIFESVLAMVEQIVICTTQREQILIVHVFENLQNHLSRELLYRQGSTIHLSYMEGLEASLENAENAERAVNGYRQRHTCRVVSCVFFTSLVIPTRVFWLALVSICDLIVFRTGPI